MPILVFFLMTQNSVSIDQLRDAAKTSESARARFIKNEADELSALAEGLDENNLISRLREVPTQAWSKTPSNSSDEFRSRGYTLDLGYVNFRIYPGAWNVDIIVVFVNGEKTVVRTIHGESVREMYERVSEDSESVRIQADIERHKNRNKAEAIIYSNKDL